MSMYLVTIDEIKSIMVAWLMPKLPKFLKESCMIMSQPGFKDSDIRWCILSPLTHDLVIGAYVHKYANVGDIDIWTVKFNGYRNINIRIDNQSWDGPKVVWYSTSDFDCFSKEEMYELYGMIGKYVYNKYHRRNYENGKENINEV